MTILRDLVTFVVDAGIVAGLRLWLIFGWVFLMAVLMQQASMLRRGTCGAVFGRWYYWFVSPGVMCHEMGHALGCLVTRTKIYEFVPFHPKGNTLGYVTHVARHGIFGAMSEFLIATGPIWFGCVVMAIASWLLTGGHFPPPAPATLPVGFWAYAESFLRVGVEMFLSIFTLSEWKSVAFVVYLYVAFAVSSEVTLSAPDLKEMWKGLSVIVLVWFVLHLIPGGAGVAGWMMTSLAPLLFRLHALLAFVFLLDLAFTIVLAVPLYFVRSEVRG